MARKIRFFKDQMSKAGVLPKDSLENGTHIIDLDDVEVFIIQLPTCFSFSMPCFRFLSPYQVKLGELEAELVEINANNDKLQRSYNELIEYKLVLDKVTFVFFYFRFLFTPLKMLLLCFSCCIYLNVI